MSKSIFDVFDAKEIESIATLIDKLGSSSFDFLKLENEDVKIVISKNGMLDIGDSTTKSVASIKGSDGTNAPAVTEPQEGYAEEAEAASIEEASATVTKEEIVEREGVVLVRAPSYGLFYAQPSPGAPPYVKIGSKVKEGDTVGLYEVMKVFSSIAAPADGEIIGIYVENGEQLEPEQPLMAIKVE